MGRHRHRTPEIGVRLPGSPLWAHRPKERRQLGRLEIRVRVPVASTQRKVAGYGLAGPLWKGGSPHGLEGSNPLPSAQDPDGETDITSRFEREVPGSTPGRGTRRARSPGGKFLALRPRGADAT